MRVGVSGKPGLSCSHTVLHPICAVQGRNCSAYSGRQRWAPALLMAPLPALNPSRHAAACCAALRCAVPPRGRRYPPSPGAARRGCGARTDCGFLTLVAQDAPGIEVGAAGQVILHYIIRINVQGADRTTCGSRGCYPSGAVGGTSRKRGRCFCCRSDLARVIQQVFGGSSAAGLMRWLCCCTG